MQCNCASRLNWGKMREREEWKCQVLSKLMWQSFGSSTLYGHWCTGVTGGALPLPTHRLHISTAQEVQRAPTAPLYSLLEMCKAYFSPTHKCLQLNWLGQELIETEYVHSILLKKVPLIQIKDIKTFTSMFLLRNSLIKQLAVPAFGFLNHLCDKSF